MPVEFSAIVINYNGNEFLNTSIQSLIDAGIPNHAIIVVDNGSNDHSIQSLLEKFPTTQVIENGCNAGFSAAVNRGLSAVETPFTLLFNNDAILDKNSLPEFLKAFSADPKAAILGSKLLNTDGSTQNSVANFPTLTREIIKDRSLKHRQYDIPTKVDSVIGACIALRMDSIKEIGLLDESYFFFLEETELCLRAIKWGYAVYHIPGAITTHIQGGTANKFRTASRIEFQRSKLIYYRKTSGWITWITACTILTIKALVNATANSVISIVLLGLNKKINIKAIGYIQILLWHLLLHPSDWGLPDKCRSK